MSTNEEIALLQNYTYENGLWSAPEGQPLWGLKDPPDFENDWAHAGALLEDLLLEGWQLSYATHGGFYLFKIREFLDANIFKAISRAWLAWQKEEK